MLKKNLLYTIVTAVAILLLGLIVVQLYWVKDAYRLKEIEFNNRVAGIMDKTMRYVERESFFFNMYGRSYIKPGEGVMVLKTARKDGGIDTIKLFNSFPYYTKPDTCFYSTGISYYDALTLVDVTMRFEYRQRDSVLDIQGENNAYKELAKENYHQRLEEKMPVKNRIKLNLLDSTLHSLLTEAGIGNTYQYAIGKKGEKDFEIVSDSAVIKQLQASPHRTVFFNDRAFTKPYELVLYFKDSDAITRSALLLTLSASCIIIILLVAAFIYFIRTLLAQKKLSEMKTDFINNMTHEFMTPVTNIALAMETLNKTGRQYTGDEKQIMDVISSENVHLRDNINKVLQVAILEKGSFLLDIVPVDIHEVLYRVARNFELKISSKKGSIDFRLHAEKYTVAADETHIINLFYNILDNSVKYVSEDEAPLILIESGNANKELWVRIKDNGIGMAQEVEKHIFDKFYRGAKGNVHDVKGFGLGLTYAKSIADAHNIQIEVSSKPGQGTIFTFWFKLK